MLALGLSVSTALPGSAGAVTLMDLLRGGPGKIARDRGATLEGLLAQIHRDAQALPDELATERAALAAALADVRAILTAMMGKLGESVYHVGLQGNRILFSLAELVMHCLAKDPEERPQNAGELVRRLAEVGTPSGGGQETLPAISLATRRTLAKALGLYAAAFVVVAALAQTAVTMIGLPDWVLPGTLVVMALGLPAVLFTAFVHHGNRVARTMAMLTPGGSITAHCPAPTASRVTFRSPACA